MSSPVNGGFACFNCGLLLAPDTARCPRCGAPQPGRANGCPGAGHPSHVPPAEPLHPAVTAIITFFFGLFGLIPCLISTSRAKRLSLPTRPHWLAFWIPELVRVSVYVIVAIGMIAGVGILAGLAPRSPGGSGGVAPSSSYSYSTTAPSATSSSDQLRVRPQRRRRLAAERQDLAPDGRGLQPGDQREVHDGLRHRRRVHDLLRRQRSRGLHPELTAVRPRREGRGSGRGRWRCRARRP